MNDERPRLLIAFYQCLDLDLYYSFNEYFQLVGLVRPDEYFNILCLIILYLHKAYLKIQ